MTEEATSNEEDGGGVPATRLPGRGRRFGDDDIHRILETAADLHERSRGLSLDSTAGLTLDEIRLVAAEAGIDPRFVDLAASHLDAPLERTEGRLAGGPIQWHFRTELEGEIDDVDRERILHAIRSVLGQKGELADVFGRMEWTHDDGTGPVIVGISSRDGKTEIDVSAAKATEAGVIHGLGIPMGGIAVGGGLAAALSVPIPLILPIIGAAGAVAYGVLRLAWRARSVWWEARLRRVVQRISSIAQEAGALPAGEFHPASEPVDGTR